jgi:hypothetical protein
MESVGSVAGLSWITYTKHSDRHYRRKLLVGQHYAHKHGVWNLFDFGVERYNECRTYGFGLRTSWEGFCCLASINAKRQPIAC